MRNGSRSRPAASGNGNGEVTYTVLPSVGAARSGTLTIAGQTFTVQQTAAPACSFKVSPLTIEVDDDRQNREVDVETSPLCTWSATSNVSWIRINGEATRIGSDDVSFQIDRNETNNAAHRHADDCRPDRHDHAARLIRPSLVI